MDKPKINVDRSKNTALIPPAFGSATSYLPDSGTALTPNLTPGGSGIVSGGGTSNVVTPPTISGNTNTGNTGSGSYESSFTLVTPDLYYAGGYIGSLKIPSIGVDVKIYQGTDDAALRYGVGHFENTSIWEGNVAIAGHNRGVNSYFGEIHTLKTGGNDPADYQDWHPAVSGGWGGQDRCHRCIGAFGPGKRHYHSDHLRTR